MCCICQWLVVGRMECVLCPISVSQGNRLSHTDSAGIERPGESSTTCATSSVMLPPSLHGLLLLCHCVDARSNLTTEYRGSSGTFVRLCNTFWLHHILPACLEDHWICTRFRIQVSSTVGRLYSLRVYVSRSKLFGDQIIHGYLSDRSRLQSE